MDRPRAFHLYNFGEHNIIGDERPHKTRGIATHFYERALWIGVKWVFTVAWSVAEFMIILAFSRPLIPRDLISPGSFCWRNGTGIHLDGTVEPFTPNRQLACSRVGS